MSHTVPAKVLVVVELALCITFTTMTRGQRDIFMAAVVRSSSKNEKQQQILSLAMSDNINILESSQNMNVEPYSPVQACVVIRPLQQEANLQRKTTWQLCGCEF